MVFGTAFAQDPSVLVLSENKNKQHIEMVVFLSTTLSKNNAIARFYNPDRFRLLPQPQARIGIALGAKNCHLLSTRLKSGRLLCLDLYHSQLRALLASAQTEKLSLTGIPIDAPSELVLSAVADHFPERQVGILLGPQSKMLLPELKSLPDHRGFQYLLVNYEDNPLLAFRQLATKSQIIIAFYDQHLLHKHTLESIFLSSFRLDVPIVGYDAQLTESGALFSLYSSLENQKSLIAETITTLLQPEKPLPSVVVSDQIQSSVNEYVAQAFNLPLKQEQLEAWLQQALITPNANQATLSQDDLTASPRPPIPLIIRATP